MRKIAVSLSKGGTGKTTTAINLAHGLALAGRRVLLVDCDTQGQASFFLGLQADRGLSDILSGEATAQEAIVQARENLWLLAGGRGLAKAVMGIAKRQIGIEKALSEALAPLRKAFDFIILDTAPGWDILSVNILFYAEEVLCPVSLEVAAIQSLGEFIQRLGDIRAYNDRLRLRYVLPTFMDRRVRQAGELLEQLQGLFNRQLCSPIRYNIRLSEATGHGKTIFEYAPKSVGAEDYKKLIERVCHE
jgi:chromosome partitioning protein